MSAAMFNMKMYVIWLYQMCTSRTAIENHWNTETKAIFMHLFNEFRTFTELPG